MRAIGLLTIALTLACSSTTSPDMAQLAATPDLGQPFELRVGEWAFVAQADLRVQFVGVPADSRCPSKALILCVWEGDGAVLVESVQAGAAPRSDTLHTTLDPRLLDLGNVALELDRLDPYPETIDPIPSGEYVATFVVRLPD